MTKLFEPVQIRKMELKNRFVRSATWEGLAGEDGACTSRLTEMMVNLARGGVGLIITGHAYVQKIGQAGPFQLGIYDDRLIAGLRDMTDAVHRADGRIVLQLAHAGCNAVAALSGMEPAGPSVFEMNGKAICRELSREEIAGTVKAFGEAARRGKEAGFDGVQLHAAHGYLLSQFLSPFYNRRQDEYGGTLENRARVLLEAHAAIRKAAGDDVAVLIKINSEDFLENGLTRDEMIGVCGMLERAGIDAIELSGGTVHSDKKLVPVRPGVLSEEEEAFYRDAAVQYKKNIRVPLMLVGGIRSYRVADRLVQEGITDFVSMSRPLIRDAGLINRWKEGDTGRSECRSDNACFRPGVKGDGIYCVTKEKENGVQK